MKPIGFDLIVDELAFMDEAAKAVLPVIVAGMPANSRDVAHQMTRAAAAAYDIAAEMLTEQRLRHQAVLGQCNGRK